MGSKGQNLVLKILNHKPYVRGFEIMGSRGKKKIYPMLLGLPWWANEIFLDSRV
jgi:hypothetical protein